MWLESLFVKVTFCFPILPFGVKLHENSKVSHYTKICLGIKKKLFSWRVLQSPKFWNSQSCKAKKPLFICQIAILKCSQLLKKMASNSDVCSSNKKLKLSNENDNPVFPIYNLPEELVIMITSFLVRLTVTKQRI